MTLVIISTAAKMIHHGPIDFTVERNLSIDLINTIVSLYINSQLEREGAGGNVLGDPVGAFVWLINALTRDGKNVRAVHIHNTGTAIDIYWEKPGNFAVADFGAVGSVELTLI